MSVKVINFIMLLIFTQMLGEPVHTQYDEVYHQMHEAYESFCAKRPKTAYVINSAAEITSLAVVAGVAGAKYIGENSFRIGFASISAGANEAAKITQEAADALYSRFSAAYPKTASAISTTVSWAYWGAGVAYSAAKVGASWSWWGTKKLFPGTCKTLSECLSFHN